MNSTLDPNRHITRKNGLPQSRYCRITENGFVLIQDDPRAWPYEIPVCKLRTLAQFSEWIGHLSEKTWFTPEVMADFTLFCCLLMHGAPDKWHEFGRRSESAAA